MKENYEVFYELPAVMPPTYRLKRARDPIAGRSVLYFHSPSITAIARMAEVWAHEASCKDHTPVLDLLPAQKTDREKCWIVRVCGTGRQLGGFTTADKALEYVRGMVDAGA